jgi:glycosyltransferase 2 family protein
VNLRHRWWRLLLVSPLLAGAVVLIYFRGPDWHVVHDAFTVVRWEWVVVAVALNLLSVLTRSVAWDTAIRRSIAPPYPGYSLVFSAFCVGLFANVVLPGRVGELARVAVLRRRLPGRKGTTATLVGSVFAHRMFDLFPALTLVVWVLLTAKIPTWAYTSLAVVLGVGLALFLTAWLLARLEQRPTFEGMSQVRMLVARIRQGLAVMRSAPATTKAIAFQFSGWICQLLAVWSAMRAFHIYQPLPAAGLVLVLMNVATLFPVWPGNFGLVQLAVAAPLVSYGVRYARGFAFGIGLQAIEASVGVGIGLIFLAREGLSYAMLKQIEEDEAARERSEPVEAEERDRPRDRVSG